MSISVHPGELDHACLTSLFGEIWYRIAESEDASPAIIAIIANIAIICINITIIAIIAIIYIICIITIIRVFFIIEPTYKSSGIIMFSEEKPMCIETPYPEPDETSSTPVPEFE